MSRFTPIARLFALGFVFVFVIAESQAQSTRPRRVRQPQKSAATTTSKSASEPLLRPEPTASPTARRTNPNDSLLDVQPVKPVVNTVGTAGTADTRQAYLLLEQKQFAAAAKAAKDLAAQHPNDPEAWKIAGFAELNMKQYAEAAKDLAKAVELQRQSKQQDPNTESALGQAYVLSEKYQEALPLLTAATTRDANKPDALMIYYRGVAEYKTGKTAEAEKSFNSVVKLNPKDSLSLFYLAQIALAKNDLDGAINSLNRATVNDARMTGAWTLLTSSYLRRAAMSTDPAKADADYINAVRSGEALIKLRTDPEAITLFGQALIGSKQYARAAAALDRAASPDANGITFYLLGVAHSRAANFPKAITALETAAKKSPDDVNIYRELGYAHEVTKQYAKALAAYERGAALAPNDPDFKESIERVKPFAK
ncbi:MAG: tetratricopeptide repeat protein [Acidobacteria bacterium]|nr:tetratricopeptide repeat protein [Acidobacteriota bacterium]MCA1627736.1 tetratricopeptide repeat protein [Acidobacteriota bacterium]